jgi:hypothetical protein
MPILIAKGQNNWHVEVGARNYVLGGEKYSYVSEQQNSNN